MHLPRRRLRFGVQFEAGAFDGVAEDRPGLLAIGGEGFAVGAGFATARDAGPGAH